MHATIKGNEGGGVRGAGGERRPAGAGRESCHEAVAGTVFNNSTSFNQRAALR